LTLVIATVCARPANAKEKTSAKINNVFFI
jgi:hypothetical protein